MNLTIALLSARRFLSRERIREIVEGYHNLSDAAFMRTFERDKDELRAMGVPIETGSDDSLFDDEVGYRISRADFELPPVDFTVAEAAVLGSATRVWQQASTAEQTISALAKLRASGVDPDTSRLAAISPRISAREPAFEQLWQATLDRRRVSFRYRGAEEQRIIQPWALTWRRGSWYVLGHDDHRDAPRLFKLARISGPVTLVGQPDAYQVPADVDLRELTTRLSPPAGTRSEATLAIRDGHAAYLRRRATLLDAAPMPLPSGFSPYRIEYGNRVDFVAELCGAGADTMVLEPAELRAHVIAQLTAVASEAGSHD